MTSARSKKDILITGASGVIGQAIARELAAHDYRLTIAGRDKNRLLALQEELSSLGAETDILIARLSDFVNCEKAVKTFFRRAKNPHGLVCNAGHLGPVGPFWETPIQAWRQSVAENFLSHATMIQAFSKAMAKRKHPEGSIVVMSGAGVGNAGDFSHVTSYSSSKAALVHLVEALAPELSRLHIRINAVAPGAVLSRMTEQARNGGKEDPKQFVSPELAAQLIEFLISPASKLITGRLLSARFDQAVARQKGKAIAQNAHWFRLRRIDYELFRPVAS